MAKNAAAITAIKALLRSPNDGIALNGIGIVEAVAEVGEEFVELFSEDLEALANHASFPVWFSAKSLLGSLNKEAPERPFKGLPAIYSLDLPPEESRHSRLRQAPSPGEPLPNPINVAETLTPFDSDLRWAAEVLERTPTQMIYRASSIMGEISDEKNWNENAERELRSHLHDAGLEFTFQRPRGQVARQAMYRVLTELFDAREMPLDAAHFLYESLRPYDPVLMLTSAGLRPNEVSPIEGLTPHGDAKEAWVNDLSSSEPQFTRRVGDSLVIGEITELNRLSWGKPSTVIHSACVTEPLDEDEAIWVRGSRLNLKQYLSLGRIGDPKHLIIMKQYDGRDSDAGNWIALHPRVGTQLGWISSPDGLFRWVDHAGEMMAETIWWKDGSLDHQPPRFDDEVGEGFLVIVSLKGAEALTKAFPTIARVTDIEREFTPEAKHFSSKTRFVNPFPGPQ